jgi:outer membrane protein insertion porin family
VTPATARWPHRGRYQRVNFEWGFAGDVRYLRTNLQYQEYWQLPWKMSLASTPNWAWARAWAASPIPIFKNFYGGGLGSVRVFEQSSLGCHRPHRRLHRRARKLNLNTELYLPVPGTGNDKTLRIFAFADTGNVWREGEKIGHGQPARLGRAGPELDLARGPAQAQLGRAVEGAAQR